MNSIISFQKLIEKELKIFCNGLTGEPKELYEPISYSLELGGKRIRPLLVLMSCDLFDGKFKNAVNPALAVEVFHNFTLLHDDIMDNAPLRRNHPTVHKKWNKDIAILAGDAMCVKAYELIAKCDTATLSEVLEVFNSMALKVCEGQQLDMIYEKKSSVFIDDYIKMISLKTAELLAASMKIGAIVGNASKKDIENLYQFGKNIGTAFQLQDDILDVYGNPEKFGKQVGGDIISNKKTFLLLKALELAKGTTAKDLSRCVGMKISQFENLKIQKEKIIAVKNIYEQLGIEKIAQKEGKFFFNNGMKYLEKVNANTNKKQQLRAFAEGLMKREI